MQQASPEKVVASTETLPVQSGEAEVLSVPTAAVEKGVEGIVSTVTTDDSSDQVTPSEKKPSVGIGARVSSLLGFKKSTVVKIPSQKVQQVKVKQAFEKEIKRLIRKSDKMMNKSRFSADKYEEIILEIRRFQAMLLEIYTVTTEALEGWYRQYVLKMA